MLVDGRKIAASIYGGLEDELRARQARPSLLVFVCAPTAETKQYLSLKQKKAAAIGVAVGVVEFAKEATTEDFLVAIDQLAPKHDGLILQLPFPAAVDVDMLLTKIPAGKDADAMNYMGEDTEILPPVVGAIKDIAAEYDVDFAGKKVVVVGRGKLVGRPAAFWAAAQNAAVTVIDKETADANTILKEADIIISGAGVPGLITPDKIKEGVIIFDAGTSEEGGVLKGDANPACAEKSALFTPVPGGIGPITIAVLLRNLVLLSRPKT